MRACPHARRLRAGGLALAQPAPGHPVAISADDGVRASAADRGSAAAQAPCDTASGLMSGRPWTMPEQVLAIRLRQVERLPIEAIAKQLPGRSVSTIRNRL